jgi:dTDP-4-dehydrorhamnose 3,5-epimerase
MYDHVSEILIIPPGHVNGFSALEADSTMIVFSDMLLEDSKNDDFRFPSDYWRFVGK